MLKNPLEHVTPKKGGKGWKGEGGGTTSRKKVGMVEKTGEGDRHGVKVVDMNININIYAYDGTCGFAHLRLDSPRGGCIWQD